MKKELSAEELEQEKTEEVSSSNEKAESKKGLFSGKKKIWIIGSIAAVAVCVVSFILIGFIPKVKYEIIDIDEGHMQYLSDDSSHQVAYVTGVEGLIFKGHYPMNSVNVDSSYNGKPVVGVYDSAFESSNVEYVNLPDTIEIIGTRAFANSSLKEINLPSGLKLIEEEAFLLNGPQPLK